MQWGHRTVIESEDTDTVFPYPLTLRLRLEARAEVAGSRAMFWVDAFAAHWESVVNVQVSV